MESLVTINTKVGEVILGTLQPLTVPTDDAGSACRGAMNMRIAKLSMDAQDKTRFEIQGKSSIKYHLKAGHSSEAKRW